jgi:homoserine kinase type II
VFSVFSAGRPTGLSNVIVAAKGAAAATVIVWKLYHIRTREDGCEDEKLIGIYTTREKARATIQRLSGLRRFKDYPGKFKIFKFTLDKDHWTEGFISSDEATYGS